MILTSIINCNCGCVPNKFYECQNCIDHFCKRCMGKDDKLCLFCYEQKSSLNSVKTFLDNNYIILDTLRFDIFKYHKYKDILDELTLIINTIENGNSIRINNNIYNYYTDSVEIYKLIDVYYYKLMKIIKENI